MPEDKKNHWNDQGDLVVVEHTIFRRVGWRINGGPNNGTMVTEITDTHKRLSMGGFSPLYIQVGD